MSKPRTRAVRGGKSIGEIRHPVWDEARAYILAGHSVSEAACEYAVPFTRLYGLCRKEGWLDDRAKIDAEVRRRIDEELTARRIRAAKDVELVSDEIASEQQQLVARHQALVRLSQDIVEDGIEKAWFGKRSKGSPSGGLKALMAYLRAAGEVLKNTSGSAVDAQAMRRKVHRLDDKDNDGGGQEGALQRVLRKMREAGKIAAPIAAEGSPEAALNADAPSAE